jgi:hypothetical protein
MNTTERKIAIVGKTIVALVIAALVLPVFWLLAAVTLRMYFGI